MYYPRNTSPKDPFPIRSCFSNNSSGSPPFPSLDFFLVFLLVLRSFVAAAGAGGWEAYKVKTFSILFLRLSPFSHPHLLSPFSLSSSLTMFEKHRGLARQGKPTKCHVQNIGHIYWYLSSVVVLWLNLAILAKIVTCLT